MIHEDITELEKRDNSALEAWLYGVRIISKTNQKKIKKRKEFQHEHGIFLNIYCNKRDRKELDPRERKEEDSSFVEVTDPISLNFLVK